MIEKHSDMEAFELYNHFQNKINESNLNAHSIYFILKTLFLEVENQYHKVLKDEYQSWNEFFLNYNENQKEENKDGEIVSSNS